MRFVAILFFLLNFFSVAYGEYACTIADLGREETYAMPQSGYFMRWTDDPQVLMHMGWGAESEISVLRPNTGQVHRARDVSRAGYDPVPVPGTNLYVQPNPLRFFEWSRSGQIGVRIRTALETNMEGNYQSAGLVSREPRRVRVLVAQSRGVLQDFVVTGAQGSLQVVPQGQGVRACNNLPNRPDMEMPIISPDGQFLATKRFGSEHTKIFRIQMPSGHCNEVADLGEQTGKVQFSPDGRYVAFRSGRDFETNLGALKVLDRITNRIRTVSLPGEKVTSFTFRPSDGSLFYVTDRDAWHASAPKNSRIKRLVGVPSSVLSANGEVASAALARGRAWWRDCGENLSRRYVERFEGLSIRSLTVEPSDSQLTTLGMRLPMATNVPDTQPAAQ